MVRVHRYWPLLTAGIEEDQPDEGGVVALAAAAYIIVDEDIPTPSTPGFPGVPGFPGAPGDPGAPSIAL